jgi:hypothetical protein
VYTADLQATVERHGLSPHSTVTTARSAASVGLVTLEHCRNVSLTVLMTLPYRCAVTDCSVTSTKPTCFGAPLHVDCPSSLLVRSRSAGMTSRQRNQCGTSASTSTPTSAYTRTLTSSSLTALRRCANCAVSVVKSRFRSANRW